MVREKFQVAKITSAISSFFMSESKNWLCVFCCLQRIELRFTGYNFEVFFLKRAVKSHPLSETCI